MATPAPPSQMSPHWGRPCGHPLVLSVFSPLLGIYALGITTRCIGKLNLPLNVTLLLKVVTTMDFGHFEPFFSVFVRSEGAMRSYCAACRPPDIKLRSCLVQRLWYTYFYAAELPIGGAWARQKWDFAIFWSFFVLWGYIPNPHAPNSSYYPLILTPTLPVNNSRKILTTWKKNFQEVKIFLELFTGRVGVRFRG